MSKGVCSWAPVRSNVSGSIVIVVVSCIATVIALIVYREMNEVEKGSSLVLELQVVDE